MNITDPIADMITRIRNANSVGKNTVDIPASNIKASIGEILKEEGFINNVKVVEKKPQNMIRIYLKYGKDDKKVITGLKRISKPGLRVYVGKDEVPRVLGGLGIAVISSSQGLMTDKQARETGVGGEVLCYIW